MIPITTLLLNATASGKELELANLIVDCRTFRDSSDLQCEVQLVTPIDWELLQYNKKRSFRMQMQGWAFFRPIMNIFDEYDNKAGLLQFMMEVAGDWWRGYGHDRDDVLTTRMPTSFSWYDMSVGYRALIVAFIIDRVKIYGLNLSEAHRTLLANLAQKHIRHLMNPGVFSLNNHGLFQIHGLRALCAVAPPTDLHDANEYSMRKMHELLFSQFDENGIHLEHSPQYHFFTCEVLRAILSSGWYDDCDSIAERLSLAERRKSWLVDPRSRTLCIGDSSLAKQDIEFPLKDGVTNSTSAYLLSDFSSSGYASIRSNWSVRSELASMLFMTAAYHSKSHKHRDCLSFEWYEFGERIVVDAGKYGYRSDKFRNYFLSARAHNSIEIEGFDILALKPYGSAISELRNTGEETYEIGGALHYPAISHMRKLHYCPGRWLVVDDALSFSRVRKYTQWFHLAPEFVLVSIQGTKVVANNGRQVLTVESLDSSLEVSVFFEDKSGMQGLVSEEIYSVKASLAIGFSSVDSGRIIRTVFSFDQNAREQAICYLKRVQARQSESETHINGNNVEQH